MDISNNNNNNNNHSTAQEGESQKHKAAAEEMDINNNNNNNHSTVQEGSGSSFRYGLQIYIFFFLATIWVIFWNERELYFFTGFLKSFSLLFGFLLTLLGWKYQSVSIFHTHGATMFLLIINVCICILALVVTTLPTSNQRYRHFFEAVCLISGAFACDLLLLILVPPFGWFILIVCVFMLMWLLYGSFHQILQCSQEILLSVSNYASRVFLNFRDWFQHHVELVQQRPFIPNASMDPPR